MCRKGGLVTPTENGGFIVIFQRCNRGYNPWLERGEVTPNPPLLRGVGGLRLQEVFVLVEGNLNFVARRARGQALKSARRSRLGLVTEWGLKTLGIRELMARRG